MNPHTRRIPERPLGNDLSADESQKTTPIQIRKAAQDLRSPLPPHLPLTPYDDIKLEAVTEIIDLLTVQTLNMDLANSLETLAVISGFFVPET